MKKISRLFLHRLILSALFFSVLTCSINDLPRRAGDTGIGSAGTSQTTTNAPTFAPVAGSFNATQNVTISTSDAGAIVCYTAGGSNPACDGTPACTTGTQYSGPVNIAATTTLKAIACKAGFTDSAVTSGVYAIDTAPPGNVTTFAATPGNGQVSLSWANPGDGDLAGIKILRKTGSYPVNNTDGTVVFNTLGTATTDSSLVNGIQYYYKAFAYDAAGNFATGAQATATPSAVTPTLEMVSVPANTGGFLMGSTAVGGNAIPEHTVASITAFQLAKYEVKYAEWLTVKTWAGSNGYTFANAGVMGDGTGDTDQHPVTAVNWRDAIVWCNAASQKDGLTPVYYIDVGFTTPLKISTEMTSVNAIAGSEDNPYINWAANGYRLPTEAEWEYAARFINVSTFTRGDAPSGWQDNNPANAAVDWAENDAVAWWLDNSGSPNSTHVVGTRAPNALGIFDMSGNVFEWSHDWYAESYTTGSPYTDADSKGPSSGTYRVARGGSIYETADLLRGSDRNGGVPYLGSIEFGFRPARRP